MSRDTPQDLQPAPVVVLAEVRRRRSAQKEDIVAPIRDEFMEEMGDLLADYVDTIYEATGGDIDKSIEELMAACSTLLALAAEEHLDGAEEQLEFIDAVAEIAADIVGDDDAQGELFDEDDDELR
jgi:hypothetical protein